MCAKLKQMSLDIGTRDRDNHLDILHCMGTRLLFDFDFVRKKMKLSCDIYFFLTILYSRLQAAEHDGSNGVPHSAIHSTYSFSACETQISVPGSSLKVFDSF